MRRIIPLTEGPTASGSSGKSVSSRMGRRNGRSRPPPRTGRYEVEFERPPGPGAVTYARIGLTATDGHRLTLRRVNFGQDNRFPPGERFLRVEGPGVYQVFRTKGCPPNGSPGESPPVGSGSNQPWSDWPASLTFAFGHEPGQLHGVAPATEVPTRAASGTRPGNGSPSTPSPCSRVPCSSSSSAC